jgi:hypothetical protein
VALNQEADEIREYLAVCPICGKAQIMILFLRGEYEDFAALLREIEDDLKNAMTIGLCDFEQFGKYRDMIRAVSATTCATSPPSWPVSRRSSGPP